MMEFGHAERFDAGLLACWKNNEFWLKKLEQGLGTREEKRSVWRQRSHS
jgi:hypothetical protein